MRLCFFAAVCVAVLVIVKLLVITLGVHVVIRCVGSSGGDGGGQSVDAEKRVIFIT
jgi:hypothetical protein